MKLLVGAFGLALGLASSANALAAAQPAAAGTEVVRKFDISKEARPAIVALQTAVKAKDAAAIPDRLAAAKAAAKTADDRYFIAQLQLEAARSANNDAAILEAIEALLASGGAQQSELLNIHRNIGALRSKLNRPDQAVAAYEQALALAPNDADLLIRMAELRANQNRFADAGALVRRAIAARSAAGAKADESWYKLAAAMSYKGKAPTLTQDVQAWIAAYPSPTSWREGLNIYRNERRPDETTMLDLLRLSRLTGALNGERDVYNHAVLSTENWASGEAQSVIDEAVKAGTFDKTKAAHKELLNAVATGRGRDVQSLVASSEQVRAAPTGRPALRVGDGFYGVGEYARAVEMYRLALSKGTVDANVVNLRIGAALARAGDKAGATAAFKTVTGPQAELAKYWLLYLQTRG